MASEFFIGEAPGRLDVMGGIADYSGSLVLQMPILQKTTVRFAPRKDFICSIESLTERNQKLSFEINIKELEGMDYDGVRRILNGSWYSYIVGCIVVLEKKKGLRFTGGDFKVESNVPLGKGVSSSASLEVATMRALSQAFNVEFLDTQLAKLAQEVENEIVGAPCGLMDQLATSFGEVGKLLPIICQPDKLLRPISISPQLRFLGIDSDVRHAVGGASYGDVRCAAFMGYSIIADSLGVGKRQIADARTTRDRGSLPYGGYLCNVSVSEFENRYKSLLPTSLTGKDFIAQYGTTIDAVTTVKADTVYPVLNSTLHPIYENERVYRFKSLLEEINSAKTFNEEAAYSLGELMMESHRSYSRCGLGSDRTDEMVEIFMRQKNNGIAGAKITGGGSGGAICVLAVGKTGENTARQIYRELCDWYATKLAVF